MVELLDRGQSIVSINVKKRKNSDFLSLTTYRM